jgi:hypothetical protein
MTVDGEGGNEADGHQGGRNQRDRRLGEDHPGEDAELGAQQGERAVAVD